jgi:hypothetical protein
MAAKTLCGKVVFGGREYHVIWAEWSEHAEEYGNSADGKLYHRVAWREFHGEYQDGEEIKPFHFVFPT